MPKSSFLTNSVFYLRLFGFLEGVSYVVLVCIAMPLKYMADAPRAVQVVGMAHGLLFVAFVLILAHVKVARGWPWGKTSLAFIASLIPFAIFYADWVLFREPATENIGGGKVAQATPDRIVR